MLDEPTAGLDPQARQEMLDLVKKLHDERGITVVLVSHSMDDVAEYADKILVMNNAELKFYDTPKEVFKHSKELMSFGLSIPEITKIAHELNAAGIDIPTDISTIEEATEAIFKYFKKA